MIDIAEHFPFNRINFHGKDDYPYTSSGSSALRMARERPRAIIIGMTPRRDTARRLALMWGVSPVLCHYVTNVDEMTEVALQTAAGQRFAQSGQTVVIAA